MSLTFLEIFFIINILFIGALIVLAIRHIIAHFKQKTEIAKPAHPAENNAKLPREVKEQLLKTAQTNFQNVLDHSAVELQRDLKATAIQINRRLDKLGLQMINDEMKLYHSSLEELRKQAEANILKAQTEIDSHQAEIKKQLAKNQAELEAKMLEEVANEKKALIEQLDTKLADAVASFLTETLGHNVDLGAQNAYLTAMLDEHKKEIIKGVVDEA